MVPAFPTSGHQSHRHHSRRAVVGQRGVAEQSQLEFCRHRFRHQFHRGRPRADQCAGRIFLGDGCGPTTQTQPNVGYICNNDMAPVTFTLPSSPSVGDVYKVAGVGAGGWIIAQNANQMIAAGNLSDARSAKAGQAGTSASIGRTSLPPPTAPNWWQPSTTDTFRLRPIPAQLGRYTILHPFIRPCAGLPSPLPPTEPNWWRRWVTPLITRPHPGKFTLRPIPAQLGRRKLTSAVLTLVFRRVFRRWNQARRGGLWHGRQFGVFTSTDSGATWTLRRPRLRYLGPAVASSADGTKLVAAF